MLKLELFSPLPPWSISTMVVFFLKSQSLPSLWDDRLSLTCNWHPYAAILIPVVILSDMWLIVCCPRVLFYSYNSILFYCLIVSPIRRDQHGAVPQHEPVAEAAAGARLQAPLPGRGGWRPGHPALRPPGGHRALQRPLLLLLLPAAGLRGAQGTGRRPG